jgi:AcrR family transcriptional regulator
MQVPPRARTYGGRSLEQRQAQRRTQLIAAAVEIWCEKGWSGVTMRGVCARAGLSDRYFYEHFDDRDALLAAVWNHARDNVIALLLEAFRSGGRPAPTSQLREAISKLVHSLADAPNGAQLLFSPNLGTPVLQQCRQQTLEQFADVLITLAGPHLRDGVDVDDLRMSALTGIGGFIELVTAWRAGTIKVSADRIVDHAARVSTLLTDEYMVRRSAMEADMASAVLESFGESATAD